MDKHHGEHNSPFKTMAKALAARLGLQERLKESILYDAYFSIVRPSLLSRRSDELAFYRRVLADGAEVRTIFDVGANRGTKTSLFVRLGARVIAVDPDPSNAQTLRRRFHKARLSPLPVEVIECALSAKTETRQMWIEHPGSAKNTLSEKWVQTLQHDSQRFGHALAFSSRIEVTTSTIDALIAKYGLPDYIKIDVEGFEPEVLAGLSRPVRCVSFEVNLPEFEREGVQSAIRLSEVCRNSVFNLTADCVSGLALERWVSLDEICTAIRQCQMPSIEIFCKQTA